MGIGPELLMEKLFFTFTDKKEKPKKESKPKGKGM